jgi:hypothetical protein
MDRLLGVERPLDVEAARAVCRLGLGVIALFVVGAAGAVFRVGVGVVALFFVGRGFGVDPRPGVDEGFAGSGALEVLRALLERRSVVVDGLGSSVGPSCDAGVWGGVVALTGLPIRFLTSFVPAGFLSCCRSL